jgi:hypothetical protein
VNFAHRIVTRMPLTELWTSEGPLVARRGERAAAAEIEPLLQGGASFVVADVGKPLR